METLGFVVERGHDVIEVVEASQRPPEQIAVRYSLEAFEQPVEILTRSPRTLEGQPVSVTIPHYARFVGAEVVARPWAYVVPEGVAAHLHQHGLAVTRLDHDRTAEVEVAYVEGVAGVGSRTILEASAERELLAAYRREIRHLPAGTLLVQTEQPLGAVAVYLCEARSDDNLVACGVIPEPAPGSPFPVWRLLHQ